MRGFVRDSCGVDRLLLRVVSLFRSMAYDYSLLCFHDGLFWGLWGLGFFVARLKIQTGSRKADGARAQSTCVY